MIFLHVNLNCFLLYKLMLKSSIYFWRATLLIMQKSFLWATLGHNTFDHRCLEFIFLSHFFFRQVDFSELVKSKLYLWITIFIKLLHFQRCSCYSEFSVYFPPNFLIALHLRLTLPFFNTERKIFMCCPNFQHVDIQNHLCWQSTVHLFLYG